MKGEINVMSILTNAWKHFCVINKHRWIVFKLCTKAGIPWRGFVHDLSKYSFVEFWEGVKYFSGERSPIVSCRNDMGYSLAWMHHKGRNKHHLEYWEDMNRYERIPVMMPYQFCVEALCDKLGASMVYKGKDWTPDAPYHYWMNIERGFPVLKHPGTLEFMDTALTKIKEEGLDAVLNKKYLKALYSRVTEK